MALENANVLIELQERKTELEKNMQELNVQMQNTSNTLLRVAGAVEVLEQIEASKSVEEIVDEVVDEVVDEDGEEDA
mgnify:CR=1 FL=1|tara:strand:- start:183 stop:413 length:231 start_codon:yes stop_codon:yes gene_type:complete